MKKIQALVTVILCLTIFAIGAEARTNTCKQKTRFDRRVCRVVKRVTTELESKFEDALKKQQEIYAERFSKLETELGETKKNLANEILSNQKLSSELKISIKAEHDTNVLQQTAISINSEGIKILGTKGIWMAVYSATVLLVFFFLGSKLLWDRWYPRIKWPWPERK